MTIGARGEGFLEVEGERIAILLTNRALAEAERLTGKTITQLARAAQNMDIGVEDTAHLLLVGMEYARREARSGGRSHTLSDAYRILDVLGFTNVMPVVIEALAAVLTYDGAAEPRPPA